MYNVRHGHKAVTIPQNISLFFSFPLVVNCHPFIKQTKWMTKTHWSDRRWSQRSTLLRSQLAVWLTPRDKRTLCSWTQRVCLIANVLVCMTPCSLVNLTCPSCLCHRNTSFSGFSGSVKLMLDNNHSIQQNRHQRDPNNLTFFSDWLELLLSVQSFLSCMSARSLSY